MTKAPTAIGADAGSRGAAVDPQSTDDPAGLLRPLPLRRVFAAVTAMEHQEADLRPVVLEVIAERVLDGPAPVSFVVILAQVWGPLGSCVGVRRLDRGIERLVADGLLTIVPGADSAAHRCRVFGHGAHLPSGGAR